MIPETKQIRVRPVWARYLRRRELEQMAVAMGADFSDVGPPTDEEKADAIEILRDAPEWQEAMKKSVYVENVVVMKTLIAEAERIFLEGSVVHE